MAKLNRDMFKPSDVNAMNEKNAIVESLNPTYNKRPDFLTLEEGYNWFRIYPPHPSGQGKTIWEEKKTSWLKVMKPIYKDGKDTGEKELGYKGIYNAKAHLGAKHDPVELFIKFYFDLLKDEGLDSARLKEFNNDWFNTKEYALTPKVKWVLYADMYTNSVTHDGKSLPNLSLFKFGFLDISNGTKNKIESNLFIYNEAAMGDPFSHVDDGFILGINKDSIAGKKDASNYYSVSLAQIKKDKNTMTFITDPLSDERLQNFYNQTPLSDIYRGAYKASDYEFQIEGLDRLDHEIAKKEGRPLIMEMPEFKDLMNECVDDIERLLPEETEQDNPSVVDATEDLPWKQEEESKKTKKSTLSDEEKEKINSQIDQLRSS